MVKCLSAMQETWVQFLGWENPLEEGIAVHFSVFSLGKSHGQRSLVSYSPKGRKDFDLTGYACTKLMNTISTFFENNNAHFNLPIVSQMLYMHYINH